MLPRELSVPSGSLPAPGLLPSVTVRWHPPPAAAPSIAPRIGMAPPHRPLGHRPPLPPQSPNCCSTVPRGCRSRTFTAASGRPPGTPSLTRCPTRSPPSPFVHCSSGYSQREAACSGSWIRSSGEEPHKALLKAPLCSAGVSIDTPALKLNYWASRNTLGKLEHLCSCLATYVKSRCILRPLTQHSLTFQAQQPESPS